MKNILSLIFLLALSVSVFAQSTSPRFGTGVRDNTGRVLTYKLTTYAADAVGNDTVFFSPDGWEVNVRSTVNITDSVNFKPSLRNVQFGDNLYIYVSKGSGSGGVRFPSTLFTNDASNNRYTIGANKTAVFQFKFNGTRYHMVSKTIQP